MTTAQAERAAATRRAPERVPVGVVFEDMPLTVAHLQAGLALFLVFAIESWEMMIIVYTAPLIGRDFHLDAVRLGALIGAIFVGMAVGALAWGPVSDRFGRKTAVVWSLALYGAISLASAASTSFPMLYGLRLLSGVAACGMLVATFPLFEELLPVRARGRYTVYLAAGWPVGMLLALAAAAWVGPFGWRWVLGVSSLAGVWAWVVAAWTPESPYWLVGAGRPAEAWSVLSRLSGGVVTASERVVLTVEESARSAVLAVFAPGARRVTLLQVAINFTFSWGYWGLQTWLPTLLGQRGLDLPQSYGFIALSALCMIPGYLAASALTARFGRKRVMIAFVAISAVAGFGFANAAAPWQLYASNLVLAFFSLGAWGVWDTWVGELYPTRVRVVGYGWGVFAQRLANIAAPSLVGLLVARSTSFNITTTFIDLFLLATTVLALFLPETEGRDLA